MPELSLFILSDGMGGEAHGEVASKLAVEGIAAHCEQGLKDAAMPFFIGPQPDLSPHSNRLVSALAMANRTIFESAKQNPSQRGMGATAVAVWVSDQRISMAHVGDSRVYLLRAGGLAQLTQDHTLVAEQVRRGVLTQDQAEESEMSSVLLRALGVEEEVEVDVDEHLLMDGDVLLLCSDGLTRMVSDPIIANTLQEEDQAQAAADRLVELANEYGGEDNITVILLRVSVPSDGFFPRMWRWLNSPIGSTS